MFSITFLDSRYMRSRDSKSIADLSMRTSGLANQFDLFLWQFGHWSPAHILLMRDSLKMLWTYTKRLTTEMIQFQTFRYWTILKFVSNHMSISSLEDAISHSGSSSFPDVAFSRIAKIDDGPKIIRPFKSRLDSRPMVIDKSFAYRHRLTTSALTQLRRIIRIHAGLLCRLALRGAVISYRAPISYARGRL